MGGVSAPQSKSSDTSPKPKKEKKKMDYAERLENLDMHIAEHPKDYQAVIARLKVRSDAIEHQMHMRKIARLKRMSEYRRARNGEK